jgi:cystathionine beta-lyase/cystathionine gamma-synthase
VNDAPFRNGLHFADGAPGPAIEDHPPRCAFVSDDYPGLASHPQHALASRQMRGYGGVVSFELGSLDRVREFLNHVSLAALAESLGGVETLISHPASMTHASVPAERRQAIGLTDDMVRISVGLEDLDDLFEDLGQALERL